MTIVAGQVLDQPVDGIIRIARFVDILTLLIGIEGRTSTNSPSLIQRPRTSCITKMYRSRA